MNGTTSSRSTCHVFINVDCNQCLRLSGSPDQLILPVWRVPQDVELPDPHTCMARSSGAVQLGRAAAIAWSRLLVAKNRTALTRHG